MLWGALVLCGWLGLGSLLSVGAALPGTLGAICADLARRLTPTLVRQAMARGEFDNLPLTGKPIPGLGGRHGAARPVRPTGRGACSAPG